MKGIYKITSPNNSIYIGQSNDIEKRRKHYTPNRCKKQRLINNSLIKYGYKNHKFEIIHELPEDVEQKILDNYEIIYYNFYKNNGFRMLNLKQCGNGGGKHSEETKKIVGYHSILRFKNLGENKIYQFNKNLNLINIWEDCVSNIAKKLNISASSINKSLLGHNRNITKMTGDCFWFYQKDLKYKNQIDLSKVVKRINQYGEHLEYLRNPQGRPFQVRH